MKQIGTKENCNRKKIFFNSNENTCKRYSWSAAKAVPRGNCRALTHLLA